MLIRQLPNALSLLRLALAAAFPLFAPQWWLSVVLIAGVSDVADGMIARRLKVGSPAGALLDAIADKGFVLSVLLTLLSTDSLQWWQVLLVLLRDFAVLAVAIYASAVRDWSAFKQMTPRIAGKLATGCIFAWFVALTGGWDSLQTSLLLLAAIASALAAMSYLLRFIAALRERHASGDSI